jgi:hypothetical protein
MSQDTEKRRNAPTLKVERGHVQDPASTAATLNQAAEIVTFSGSRYLVAESSDGYWWLVARNVRNPYSCAVPSGVWRIDQPWPWPPILGHPLHLLAAQALSRDDPTRAPGGGKVTSSVQQVLALTAAQWEQATTVDSIVNRLV